MSIEKARNLVDLIYDSPTAYHAVVKCREILGQNGFNEIKLENLWKLEKGGKYYLTQNDSSIFAFTIGENCDELKFKIVGAHTDSPGIKIKPNPEILTEGYLKLNTEIYGGPILNTWFDRPLALAGRVFIKGSSVMVPECKFINIKRPIAILPNLAIHMNRNVNTGVAIDNQKDILPILKTVEGQFEKKNYLLKLIATELDLAIEDILDFDIYLYEYEKGCVFGLDNEFISSARIDDLQAVFAGLDALNETDNKGDSVNFLACFDNEEVGSSSKQGADSQLLSNILERIVISLCDDNSRENYLSSISRSFMISLDGAHSVHPNKPEKCDITNKPVINSGPVIKISTNQKYTSDSHSISIYKEISREAGVPCQIFVNHSNEKGGSTIGPINSTHLEIKSVDVGMPMFAMHSIREMCGVRDHADFVTLLKTYYNL
jgi:aspartyl aminopeptidase